MISFFKQIRRALMFSDRTGRYLKYALGEIVLIIVGIFLALQLQNWNEKRKQNQNFRNGMEKIYNGLTIDIANLNRARSYFGDQINMLDHLLKMPDSVPADIKPLSLFFLATTNLEPFKSETTFYLDRIDSEDDNLDQMELLRQLVRYNKNLNSKGYFSFNIDNSYLSDILLQLDIHYPKMHIDSLAGGYLQDSLWYSKVKLDNLKELLNQDKLRGALKTFRTYLVSENGHYYNHLLDAQSIINNILKQYPDLKIIYQDVGIIGTSIDGFDDVGGRSTPMTNTDEENSIWEIELYLKKGRVKFRCHDSWAQNWGAYYGNHSDLTGNALIDGADISINEAGTYHITLNLKDLTYKFEKLED